MTLEEAVKHINTLYNSSSTPPAEGEEDFIVWTDLLNIAISIWENEEGVLWRELFVKLADSDGDQTTATDTLSYNLPSDFRFPVSSYVWYGSSYNKTPIRIINPNDLQLYENVTDSFAYFLNGSLEFNSNMSLPAEETLAFSYYKSATELEEVDDEFEMSDPMFAVYYALSELKKEEGDTSALTIATQKLEAMKTKNEMGARYQDESTLSPTGDGMGY